MAAKKIIVISISITVIVIIVFLGYWFVKKESFSDLTLVSSDISFSPQQPNAEDLVTLTAKISNTGDRTAGNILVRFFDDEPEREGKRIGEAIIDSIAPGENRDVSVEWRATLGAHKIYVLADAENQIKESNEENNKAARGIVVSLPVIESRILTKNEFLEYSSIQELNNIAEEKGYTQLISANHSDYPQETESVTGVLFSEEQKKFGYLVKFESQELDIYENPFFIEIEGENIILTTEEGEIVIKDGEISSFLEEEYHSCSYDHCTLACFIYYVVFDEIWGTVTEKTCDACKKAVLTSGEPETIAATCTACASAYVGAGLGCATYCKYDSCSYCLSSDCGSHKLLGYSCDYSNLMHVFEGYGCDNPAKVTSYCRKAIITGLEQECDYKIIEGEWGEPYCSGDSVVQDREVDKGFCKVEEGSYNDSCAVKTYNETQELRNCQDQTCNYTVQEDKKAWCKDGDCICCEADKDCREDEIQKLSRACLDENTIGTLQRTYDYSCQPSGLHCILDVDVEGIDKETCPDDYYGWGSWQCIDENTRTQDYIFYDYSCQMTSTQEGLEPKCLAKEEIVDTHSEDCPEGKACNEGDCITCLTDAHCQKERCVWEEDWTCKDSDTRMRTAVQCQDYYCQDGECYAEMAEPEVEYEKCWSNQKCHQGECVENYALIVGQNGKVIKYNDSADYSVLDTPAGFTNDLRAIDFYSEGALIVGNSSYGKVLKYDGENLAERWTGLLGKSYRAIAFNPDNSYALILESGGVVKYDGQNFSIISNTISGKDVAWKPDGSYALIVGVQGQDGQGFWWEGVYKYDGENFTFIQLPSNVTDITGDFPGLQAVDWKPDGSYALIVGMSGEVLEYDGNSFTVQYDLTSASLEDVAFKPDGSYALIVGQEFGNQVTIEKYDGQNFSLISADTTDSYTKLNYYGVSWRNDSSALIVGTKETWDPETGNYQGSAGEVLEYINGVLSEVIGGFSGWLWGISWLDF